MNNNKFAIYFFIKDINQDELDRLQSSLDPWARIQQQLKEKEASDLEKSSEAITDETPTTTSRPFRLFQPFSRAPPPPKRTTTTFKPRSLADLFVHRGGQKIGKETTTEEPQEEQRSQAATNKAPFSPTPGTYIFLNIFLFYILHIQE